MTADLAEIVKNLDKNVQILNGWDHWLSKPNPLKTEPFEISKKSRFKIPTVHKIGSRQTSSYGNFHL